ncbi:39S ribosomal protein L11, mitochondrial [Venturia canescens]|uniref:39S ribosomal protein L11, mitochondrial n=1 Tax=Venturia canescens TaxID=32260 RepID=UPI001C9C7A55|nr:39S ribosomal protein L11, mitochondrial [Venturia canescens]
MSKSGRMRTFKKMIEKVDHSSTLRTNVLAGLASPAPPLGPMLGQRNINIASFCKDFNERTENIKEGIPLPCRVKVKGNRSYDLVIHQPPAVYFLKQAAGIQKGAMNGEDKIAGKITLKHLYEIAKIKSKDPPLALMTLQQITQMLVGVARTCGIEIVRDLDPVEYADFLEKREIVVAEQVKLLQEAKEAKMLRTT